MKNFLCTVVLFVILFLISGCGGKAVKDDKETYDYDAYAHPKQFHAIDVSSILSVSVIRPERKWRVSYNPEKDTEVFYSAWEIAEGYQTTRMADISSVRTLFEAVEVLSKSCQGEEPVQNEEGEPESIVVYEDKIEQEILSVKFSFENLPEGALAIGSLTAFDMILKLPVLENLDDLSGVELYFDNRKVNLNRQKESWMLNGKEITQEKAKDLYQIILGILLQGETESLAMPSATKETGFLDVHYVRKDGKVVKVMFGPPVDGRCQVNIDGIEEFWVCEKDVENIICTMENALESL